MICSLNFRKFVLYLLSALLISFPILADDSDPSDSESCLDCHDTEIVDSHEVDIVNQLGTSVHDGMECIDCHTSIKTLPHDEDLQTVSCSDCHPDVSDEYIKHGRADIGTDIDIPECSDCHGHHDIQYAADPLSRTSHDRLPETCGNCHESIDLTSRHPTLYGNAIAAFSASIHGQHVNGDEQLAATCTDCHSSDGKAHRIYPSSETESTINHFNIPNTCGKCHPVVAQEFWDGIHGQMVKLRQTDAPVCTNCHGEHGIIPWKNPLSPVSPQRVASSTCIPCHESAYINERYTGPTGEHPLWYDSYHGVKSSEGDISVANCASCHAAHLILSKSDPASRIHPDNLQETCGECHNEISSELAHTPIHQPPGISRSPLAALIRIIYIVLIVVVIGGMVIHCLIDFRKHARQMHKSPQVPRMNRNELWQHLLLILSFSTLVLSGFSLRFADSWWVSILFGWEGGFPMRGLIHRFAAGLFSFVTVWHTIYLFTGRGRQFLIDMLPRMIDLKQVGQLISYNLGIRSSRPAFARFSYIEKAEYWAIVWGTIIMIITGISLWFDNFLVSFLPQGSLDIMLVVHYYEAWLATLAILVWHMYATVFNPGVYPMNASWISGTMPKTMYDHEHAGEVKEAQSLHNNSNEENDSAPKDKESDPE